MKNQIQVFTNSEFGEIRTLNIDGEPWFVGKDVCGAFGDKNHIRSMRRVDEIDKQKIELYDSMNRKQSATVINESGLYALLFAMQPQKANNDEVSDAYPIAVQQRINKLRKFKRWVTAEVLPSLRKHGAYMTEDVLKQAITTPEFIIQLATALKEEQQARKSAEETLCKQKPLVDFAHQVSNTADLIDVNTMAKLLSDHGIRIGRNRLFRFLKEANILMDSGLPYQMYVDAGYFKVKESTYRDPYGNIHTNRQTLVTGKGQLYIAKKVKELWAV